MDVTRRGRTPGKDGGRDNHNVWLLHPSPKRPDGGTGDDPLAVKEWSSAPVIELPRRRPPTSLPPLGFNALDGTTGLPLHLSDAETCRDRKSSKRGGIYQGSGNVLLVMPDEEMRTWARERLLSLGYAVSEVSTPLQAVWTLEHPPGGVGAVVVAQRLQHTRGADLLAFLYRRYPQVLRVLVAPASDSPANDVDHRIDHVLPLDLGELEAVFPARGQGER